MGFAIDQPVLWPYPPDWSNPVSEALAFLSDAMQSETGMVQARGLRDVPRRLFSFQSLIDGDARRVFDAVRFDIGVKQFLLPIWPDVQVLGSSLSGGSDTVPCDTAGFDFVDGGQAVLWSDINNWELISIDTVESDHLALSADTANAWAAGTLLYPLRKARLQSVPQASYYNGDLSTVQVQCLIDEPCDWPAAWPTTTTYRGVPVLEWRNEESDDPTDQFDRISGTVDQDVGPVYYFDLPGVPFRTQSQRFQLWGRDAHSAFRSLLYQLNGRTGQAWVPSWLSDVRFAASVASSDVEVSVPWMGYTVFGREQPNRRDLAIELNDGAVLYRRITDSAEAGETETLTIDSALGVDVDPSAIRQIGFLSMCASAADTFQIDHQTDAGGEAVASLNWQAVKSDV